MKNIRKILALILSLAMVLSLAACGGNGENTAPAINGVADQTVEAGSEFDALAGVTATDAEDGDITSLITIEATPALTFKNGKATPENAGSYELVYSVTDKGGETVEAYATLTVTKQTGEATVLYAFDFADQTVDAKGWTAKVAEGVAATGELKQGAYVFDITNPGNGDGDIQLVLANMPVKAADYKVKVWAKSTANTYAHILARDEQAEGWSTFGGAFNVVIGEEIAPLELNFTVPGEGSTELLINLGKITPNPENPADTTPENFTVTIDKIEVYEITGEETQTPVYTNDFAAADENAVVVSAGDGAAATASFNGEAAVVTIDSYPTEGGVWSIKADIALPGVTIVSGEKYFYSFKINAANGQGGEALVESATLFHEARANFNGLAASAGEDTVVTAVFTAEANVSDPVIRLQIGNPSEGAANNTIVIDDVVFGVVEGDKETNKTIYAFNAFGPNTANAANSAYPWQTFNGTDEDNDRGVGTIWTENGHMFYRIDQGGVTDWHNKLICGYGDNPLVLPADSYFVVEIVAKASKDVSCGFFLNPLGSWDPRISEGLDLTTEEQTFTFETNDILITDMNFEMLFQFGSEATANLGEVTVEIVSVTIYQKTVN